MRNNKGFTLVELLVVVGIIGVLASVSIVSVNSVRQKGRDAKRISEVKEMQSGLETFFASNNSYPIGIAGAAKIPLGTLAGQAAADGDNLVMCTTDNDAVAAVNEYGGLGFRMDITAMVAEGDGGCVGTPYMTRVPKDSLSKDQLAGDNYMYQAKECAKNLLVDVAPCTSYELTAVLEAGTGSFKVGTIKATPNGISN